MALSLVTHPICTAAKLLCGFLLKCLYCLFSGLRTSVKSWGICFLCCEFCKYVFEAGARIVNKMSATWRCSVEDAATPRVPLHRGGRLSCPKVRLSKTASSERHIVNIKKIWAVFHAVLFGLLLFFIAALPVCDVRPEYSMLMGISWPTTRSWRVGLGQTMVHGQCTLLQRVSTTICRAILRSVNFLRKSCCLWDWSLLIRSRWSSW